MSRQDDYIPRPLSKPIRPLPSGAWDCHSHVFGPFNRYPIRAGHRYTPPEAPWQDYEAMRTAVGFDNGSLVHASSSAYDNSGTLEAISHARGRVVGVAVPTPSSSDADLQALHEQGVRAVRFAPAREPEDAPGTLDFDIMKRWAPRLKELGWHIQVHNGLANIVEYLPVLRSMPVPVVLDHLGGVKPDADPEGADFRALLDYARDNEVYVKLTLRVASKAPDYSDVRVFHDRWVETIPDRVIFGSDWPFINRRTDPPRVGHLVDIFDEWVADETLRRKVFVETPLRLFGGS
ncbi:MAG: amidohydrolase family protein [Alphaproteobacteria bacterium]